MQIITIITAIIFVLFGAFFRLLPHPPNFAPIAAIALFGGAYLPKKIALVLPLLAMLVSDVFIGFYEIRLMIFVYFSFLICVVLGFWLKKNKKWQTVLGSSILGALIFYLLTNFAVWAFSSWYSKDFFGLIQSYVMALPFLRNSLLGDLFYTSFFFGAYEIIGVLIRKKIKNHAIGFVNIKN